MIRTNSSLSLDKVQEDHKILQKALILASLDLREAKARTDKLRIENNELKRNIPPLLLPPKNIDLNEFVTNLGPKLEELKEAVVTNRVYRQKLSKDIDELKEKCMRKEVEFKALKRRAQIQKKGSYFMKHQIKKAKTQNSPPKEDIQD